MINVDTEQLQDMMRTLRLASGRIDEASDLLLSVTTHNGWACKERYQINDYILDNRKRIKVLQSDCGRFCTAGKAVADEFVETENSISQLFPSVEAALAQILANPVRAVLRNVIKDSTEFEKGSIADRYASILPVRIDIDRIIPRTTCPHSGSPSLVKLSEIDLTKIG